MPHIDIQMSKALKDDMDGRELTSKLHHALTDHETIILEDIKTRLTYLDHVIVGAGTNGNMVHIALKLMPGRPTSLKKAMTTSLLSVVQSMCGEKDVSITIETQELDATTYTKANYRSPRNRLQPK